MVTSVIPDRDSSGKILNINHPFGAKADMNFRGEGIKYTFAADEEYTMELPVTWAKAELTGVEVMGNKLGDNIQLKILDTATGTYSTIPNYVLNQFGFDWNLPDTFYRKELPYYATLHQGMRIAVVYKNNSGEPSTVYINFDIHEALS